MAVTSAIIVFVSDSVQRLRAYDFIIVLDRDDGRLGKDDAAVLDIDQTVCSTEVDADIA